MTAGGRQLQAALQHTRTCKWSPAALQPALLLEGSGFKALVLYAHPLCVSKHSTPQHVPFPRMLLVVCTAVFDAANANYWSTPATATTGPFRLQVQNDGNVVIYNGANGPIWATNTVGR